MVMMDLKEDLKLAPVVQGTPHRHLWSSYDDEVVTLYISFKKPSYANDSEITDDDVIIRYGGDEVIGLTILHAGKR